MAVEWLRVAYDDEIINREFDIDQKSDNYSMSISDFGKCIILTGSVDKVFTLPNSSTLYLYKRIRCATYGTGILTINPYTGGSINGFQNLVSVSQYSWVELMLIAENTWIVYSSSKEDSSAHFGSWHLLPNPKSGYSYIKEIKIDKDNVSGSSNLINFPLVFKETKDYLKTTGNGGYVTDDNGYDIIFTDSDATTQLNHEIIYYDDVTGEFIANVKIPTLKYNEDTIIYLHYGNNSIDTSQENVSGTFSQDYVLVHHMNDASGTIVDSLGSHSSNSQTGMTYQQNGKIHKSIYFDEVDDHYTIADFAYGDSFTISLWFKEEDATGSLLQYMFSHGVAGANPSTLIRSMEYGHTFHHRLYATTYDDVSSVEEVFSLNEEVNVMDGTWHLFQYIRTRNGTTKLVVDGILRDSYSSPDTTANPSTSIYVGARQDLDADRFFGGWLAELRIADVDRTVDWCITEYKNQLQPSFFYSIF